MQKIGIDIIEIKRIEKSIKNDRFLKKVYTENEISYCSRTEDFAGIFAAKEAYYKAVGTGIKFPLTNIEIQHDEFGNPHLNVKNSDVSISHDGDYAIAAVIINA